MKEHNGVVNNLLYTLFHRVISPVDGKSMEGIWSEKLLQGRDFEAEGKVIKCTEVSKNLCCIKMLCFLITLKMMLVKRELPMKQSQFVMKP